MTDYSELVKRLRACAALITSPDLFHEAADAIEALERRIEIMRTFADGWNSLANECMRRLKKLSKAMPKWIPVTERLPEDHTRVIGFMAWKTMTAIEHQNGKWYSIDHLEPLPDEAVTHWMPLPDPPEEVEA